MIDKQHEKILDEWNDIKDIVKNMELDVHKNAHSILFSGILVRNSLRSIRKKSFRLIKLTLELDKLERLRRKQKRDAK